MDNNAIYKAKKAIAVTVYYYIFQRLANST